jgi:hypothetical protein
MEPFLLKTHGPRIWLAKTIEHLLVAQVQSCVDSRASPCPPMRGEIGSWNKEQSP